MQVSKLMTKKFRVLSPDEDLDAAIKALVASRGRHLAVVKGKDLVGIVSEWDILRACTRRMRGDMRVAQFMTGNVHTTTSKETLANLALRMVEERVGCLPVVDDDALVGIVDVNDVIVAMAAEQSSEAASASKGAAKAKPKTKPAEKRTAGRR